MMMSAPCETSLAAQALAIAGLLPCVLQVMSRSFVPPALFTDLIRSFAVASAGPSNGGHVPDAVVSPADRDRLLPEPPSHR